jgi:hypothetical protein
MATRRRKTGQFKKSTSRRRSKPKTNLTNIAVSALVANSVSNNVAGIGIWDFLTAGTSLNSRSASGYLKNSGDSWNNIITLKEVMGGEQTSSRMDGNPISEVFMDNIKANWLPLMVGVVGIPIIAKVATKLIVC